MSEPNQPGGGKGKLFSPQNKWYWIGGSVGAVVLIYYFHKRGQAASATPTVGTGTDTSGSYGTDSSSYYDESGQYTSAYGGAYGTTPSLYGYYDPSTGAYVTSGGTTVVTAPSNNAQWAQQAGAYLISQGYDATTVGTALGAYLMGVGLTNDQMAIVQAALAYEGNPPTTVPAPHVNAPSGQTTTVNTPIAGTFIRNIADGNVWQIYETPTKRRYHVGQPTLNKLKAANQYPNIQNVLPTDARLRYQYAGVE